MGLATVIHIKDCPRDWRSNPNYVFIGRPSKWGNPYPLSKYARSACIALYQGHLERSPGLVEAAKIELQGKILVCYCKPEDCHGDLLAAIANGR